MKNFTLIIITEFEQVLKETFQTAGEASLRLSEWLSWHESGETPLYSLEILEDSEILEKYEF